MIPRWRAAALVAAALPLLAAALPLNIPQRPPARVTDLARLLSPDQRQTLEERLAAFERETSHQVAVLLLPSLGDQILEPLAQDVYTTWKLGRAGVDNGALLLVAVRDRKVRIHTGYGLEPSLPDGLAGSIIREAMAPRFRQGDFFGGISAALDRIFAATRNADLASVPIRRAAEARRAWGVRLAAYLLVGLALFGLAHFAARRFLDKAFWILFGLGGAGLAWGAWLLNAVPWQMLLWWAGVGVGLGVADAFVEEFFRCPRCGGWLRRQVSPVPGSAEEEAVVSSCPRCRFRSQAVRRAAALGSAVGAGLGYWIGSGGGGWGGGGGGGDGGFSGGGGDSGGGGASGGW